MKQLTLLTFYTVCTLQLTVFTACKKEPKPQIFSGQLLLTKKHPLPLANKKIEIYQQGSPSAIGLNSGSTHSVATGTTDANGFFRISFTPGTSRFIVFSGTNSSPLVLSSALAETSFPNFYRSNFSDSAYDPSKPVYVGKSIDTAIIKVSLISNLTITDTLGLRANTINGNVDKEYSRMLGNAGTILIIDTVYNLLLTRYDGVAKKFINDVYAGRKWTTVWGYKTISSEGVVLPTLLSVADETKTEITFYYKK